MAQAVAEVGAEQVADLSEPDGKREEVAERLEAVSNVPSERPVSLYCDVCFCILTYYSSKHSFSKSKVIMHLFSRSISMCPDFDHLFILFFCCCENCFAFVIHSQNLPKSRIMRYL